MAIQARVGAPAADCLTAREPGGQYESRQNSIKNFSAPANLPGPALGPEGPEEGGKRLEWERHREAGKWRTRKASRGIVRGTALPGAADTS